MYIKETMVAIYLIIQKTSKQKKNSAFYFKQNSEYVSLYIFSGTSVNASKFGKFIKKYILHLFILSL